MDNISCEKRVEIDLSKPLDLEHLENVSLHDPRLDPYYYVPANVWPEDATEMDRPDYRHVRWTKWKDAEISNESNKKLLDEMVAWCKEKHPEIGDPLESDEFWLHNVDELINNSLKNRDYKYELDYDDKLFDHIGQYDVFMQVTLGGYTTHPMFIYGIRSRVEYMVYITYDEYARQQIQANNDKWENHKKDFNPDWHVDENDKEVWPDGIGYNEYMHDWQRIGAKEYYLTLCKMVQEGHCTFKVKPCDVDREAHIRWVDHSSAAKDKINGDLHKSIW